MQIKNRNEAIVNSWEKLKEFTDARIALGRAGHAIPTKKQLEFQMDHANARDAIHIPLDMEKLLSNLPNNHEHILLESQATDRITYLQRPDLGRRLSKYSVEKLEKHLGSQVEQYDAAIVIADGLSSTAVQLHAPSLLKTIYPALQERGLNTAPVCIVNQGRVAIGDEIGQILGVDLLILIVGERPGLSSPDSLGIYYTYKPSIGLQDSSRNCISNIRPAGLSFNEATAKLTWLIDQSIKIGQSGVALKDQSEPIEQLTELPKKVFLLR